MDWMVSRHRRADTDFVQGFRSLAVMIAYASGFGNNNQSPTTHGGFEAEVKRLEALYTNYGCHCWIDGVQAGLIGGGKTRDMTDHHCQELNRHSFKIRIKRICSVNLVHFFIMNQATKPGLKHELGQEIVKHGYYAYTMSEFEILTIIF